VVGGGVGKCDHLNFVNKKSTSNWWDIDKFLGFVLRKQVAIWKFMEL